MQLLLSQFNTNTGNRGKQLGYWSCKILCGPKSLLPIDYYYKIHLYNAVDTVKTRFIIILQDIRITKKMLVYKNQLCLHERKLLFYALNQQFSFKQAQPLSPVSSCYKTSTFFVVFLSHKKRLQEFVSACCLDNKTVQSYCADQVTVEQISSARIQCHCQSFFSPKYTLSYNMFGVQYLWTEPGQFFSMLSLSNQQRQLHYYNNVFLLTLNKCKQAYFY